MKFKSLNKNLIIFYLDNAYRNEDKRICVRSRKTEDNTGTDRETLLSSGDGGCIYFPRRGSRARALTRQRLPAIDIICESPLAEERRGERARASATGKW